MVFPLLCDNTLTINICKMEISCLDSQIAQYTLVCGFCKSRKGETGGGEWDHPQGDIHIVAVVASCKNGLVGTG